MFQTLYCAFDQPTSTTTEQNVACSFTKGGGVVLKFGSADSNEFIKTIDMSLFSNFPHEREQLVFETRLHIKDIFIPRLGGWIGKNTMSALSLFDLLIHGSAIYDAQLLKKKKQRTLAKMMAAVRKNEIAKFTKSEYVNALIESVIARNQIIWLNAKQLQLLDDDLRRLFISETESDEFGEFVNYLREEHQAVICPIFMSETILNKQSLEFIAKAQEIEHRNVEIGLQGPLVKFEFIQGLEIIFQPKWLKIGEAFHVQMRLLSTPSQQPIKVHFDVECEIAGQYHASLHPRLMDKAHENTFTITLPAIPEDATQILFQMSIMIHDERGTADRITNYELISDMSAVATSNAFPNALSAIYGFSNSVISVLDSLSDFFFIFLLFRQSSRVAAFLLVLLVGNLVSVASAVSAYIVRANELNPRWGVLLFVLSPFMAVIDWLMSRIGKRGVDSLTVSLGHDGLLLWFQLERIRNRVFLIETVFESCCQLILQFVAIFVLELAGTGSALYLILSVAISLAVILSKLVLVAYDQNRCLIALKLLSYSLDVLFALLAALFVGAAVFKKAFSFVGCYLVVELLVGVSFWAYSAAQSLDLFGLLYLPFLLVAAYPMSVLNLAHFSIYPAVLYVACNPEAIGKNAKLHQALFKWC
ncbi:MAG: hypothetical protein MK041_12825, partial [Aquabacterium sp.]|nr:hypothetical protein [Aquabacterium sp.]